MDDYEGTSSSAKKHANVAVDYGMDYYSLFLPYFSYSSLCVEVVIGLDTCRVRFIDLFEFNCSPAVIYSMQFQLTIELHCLLCQATTRQEIYGQFQYL